RRRPLEEWWHRPPEWGHRRLGGRQARRASVQESLADSWKPSTTCKKKPPAGRPLAAPLRSGFGRRQGERLELRPNREVIGGGQREDVRAVQRIRMEFAAHPRDGVGDEGAVQYLKRHPMLIVEAESRDPTGGEQAA